MRSFSTIILKIALFLSIFIFYPSLSNALPGSVKILTSDFDNSTEISLEPAFVCKNGMFGGCPIQFGLFMKSTMPKDSIILDVILMETESFADGKSLHFKIDGEIVSFASIDTLTEFNIIEGNYKYNRPVQTESSKRYLIDKAFLERLLNAKEVLVKVALRRTYVEADFSKKGPTMALSGFKKFYKKITE